MSEPTTTNIEEELNTFGSVSFYYTDNMTDKEIADEKAAENAFTEGFYPDPESELYSWSGGNQAGEEWYEIGQNGTRWAVSETREGWSWGNSTTIRYVPQPKSEELA